MSQTQKGLAPIILIIIAAILLGGGYVVYKTLDYNFSTDNPPNPIRAEDIKKETKLTDDISDWKTYRNEKYGFEVGYPRNWKEKGNSENSQVDILIFGSPDYLLNTRSGSSTNQGRAMSVRIFKNRIHKSIQELEEAIFRDGDLIGIKNTNLKIVGSDRIMYDFEYGETRGHAIHILTKTIEIEIGVIADLAESELENKGIFNGILSTFKFTK